MSRPSTPRWPAEHPDIPLISDDDDFGELARKLSFYFTDAITLPHTFEELRSLPCGRILTPLIAYISDNVHHPAVVCALLALKAHFSALEEASDEPGVNEARGYACELVAWQFLTNLSEREAIDFLLLELPPAISSPDNSQDEERDSVSHQNGASANLRGEATPLLGSRRFGRTSSYFGTDSVAATLTTDISHSDNFASQFENLSALEIASVSDAKKFLSQRPVQKIINGVWRGDIVFWETLSVNSVKCPKLYNRRRGDPFCRLRVPRYLKIFETIFFATFLALYYAVLVQRSFSHVTPSEVLLYIWIAGFAYDELGDWIDAGQTSFYASDFWWIWDISIVLVGTIFFALRLIGLSIASTSIIDLSYDVLGLEALFLVPRIFALLSLNPYFGTLIPCLKEMTKDFIKFLSLVVILYLGFLTTFTLLARDQFTPREMSWILVKVFFGSSYLGFDVAQEISPYFGPPVMLVFVALTNILLITSLISLLSNSLTKVLDHAREEYLFIYSVYVLEASASNRLTYYLPPLNLIPLVVRPLRLMLPSERLRSARIILLKATHLPFVGAIWAYEQFTDSRKRRPGAPSISGPETPTTAKRVLLRSSLNSPRPLAAGFQATVEGNGNAPGRSQPTNRPHTRGGPPESDSPLKSFNSSVKRARSLDGRRFHSCKRWPHAH
ncbi:uncharacterized protein BDR25DRAFT_125097 [Lindgomyces ingoldianus]|uniref:Uncharacterized protein n=1 Tax=Lindgomyces ingoldianus TaxID=673940 RepID=A0ACB6R4U2_9PLEO|nr:uncharacterized protein BDR25DRAFT_125097 [Lindgomyces ingoldianus]KAF2473800.1 hypothetical protein BDR25DRAFT_125097 [Lindgomyces ingoldianus]